MVLFKMRTSMSANIADLIWYIIFVSSTPFILLFFPYIIPWYEGGFLMPEMLMVLPVTVGTATLGCITYSRLLCRLSLLRPLSRVPASLSALHPGVYLILSPTVPFLPPSAVV